MNRQNRKKGILTIPNLLSLVRLVLIPVYIGIYRSATLPIHFLTAALILAFSCLTDLADGRIARKYNMVSTLGKILDPLADKATQISLTFCLSLKYGILRPVFSLLIIKECFQTLAAVLALRRGKMLPGALISGKICTTVLFASLFLLVLFPRLTGFTVGTIAAIDTISLLIAFFCYILAYYGRNPSVRDFRTE